MTTKALHNLIIAFIGSGTMGEAIIHALLGAGKLAPEQIVASDVLVKRGEELKARHGVRVTTDNVAGHNLFWG